MENNKKIAFEEKYKDLDRELEKRRIKWKLKACAWFDFDDLKQIILIHIHKKWDYWDQNQDFLPWCNRIITNQIINVLRNLYLSVSRPCLTCPANEGEDKCRIYHKQCNLCPLYANWEKNRKSAFDIRLPVSIENHTQEAFSIPEEDADVENKTILVHEKMKEHLTPIQYRIYKYLYIDGKTEEEVAILMGYKSNEKNRNAGYKQIQSVKKLSVETARKIIATEIY